MRSSRDTCGVLLNYMKKSEDVLLVFGLGETIHQLAMAVYFGMDMSLDWH